MNNSRLFLAVCSFLLFANTTVRAQSQTPPPAHAPSADPDQKTITLEELQQMALQNNPTFAQAAANIRAAEGRKQQSGLYPNPTVGYQGEQIRGGSFRGGEQGFFVQQNIVLAGKLGLNQNIFEQEKKQAETEADEQKLRVVTNVKMSFIQSLAAQQTLELRQNLGKLADDAVETSHQLANVGQADAPDVLEAEVEAQQADLAIIMAEQNQQRAWKELATVVGNPRLHLMRLEGTLEDTPAIDTDALVEKIVNESPAVKIAELGVKKAEAALARAKRETIPDLQVRAGMEQNRELLDATGQLRRPARLRRRGGADSHLQSQSGRHRYYQSRRGARPARSRTGETRSPRTSGNRSPELRLFANCRRALQKSNDPARSKSL